MLNLLNVIPVMAAESTGATPSVSTVIDATGDVVSLAGKILSAIVGQPILLFFVACSIVGVGVGVIRGLRHAI